MTDTNTGPSTSGAGSDSSKLDQAAAALQKAKAVVSEQASAVGDWASQQGEALRGVVQEKPLASIGVSAGATFAAGLVFGFLLAKLLD